MVGCSTDLNKVNKSESKEKTISIEKKEPVTNIDNKKVITIDNMKIGDTIPLKDSLDFQLLKKSWGNGFDVNKIKIEKVDYKNYDLKTDEKNEHITLHTSPEFHLLLLIKDKKIVKILADGIEPNGNKAFNGNYLYNADYICNFKNYTIYLMDNPFKNTLVPKPRKTNMKIDSMNIGDILPIDSNLEYSLLKHFGGNHYNPTKLEKVDYKNYISKTENKYNHDFIYTTCKLDILLGIKDGKIIKIYTETEYQSKIFILSPYNNEGLPDLDYLGTVENDKIYLMDNPYKKY
jgi:hypothetical protein